MLDRDDFTRLDQTAAVRSTLIAQRNDAFRAGRSPGRVAITRGVLALGNGLAVDVLAQVRAFDAFNADNDPYQEHDFGSLTVADTLIFWKIDYYDVEWRGGSPDPADDSVTARVLTIMLAEEY